MRLSGRTDSLLGALIDSLMLTATDLRLNISRFFAKSEFLFSKPGKALYLGLTFGLGLLKAFGTFILFSAGASFTGSTTFSTLILCFGSTAYSVFTVIIVSYLCLSIYCLNGLFSFLISSFLIETIAFSVTILYLEAAPKTLGISILVDFRWRSLVFGGSILDAASTFFSTMGFGGLTFFSITGFGGSTFFSTTFGLGEIDLLLEAPKAAGIFILLSHF